MTLQRNTLLFDHDGVLVDTEKWYFEASRRVLETVGVVLSRDEYLENNRLGRSSWTGARNKGLSDHDIGGLKSQRNEIYQEALVREDIEIPGVTDTLSDLRDLGCQMAIITTARREDFELIHRDRRIAQFFDFVLCYGDYPRPKPLPDPYLAGLERFGADRSSTLVIEDTRRGLESAKAAEIDCAIVRSEFTADEDFSDALHRIETLADLNEVVR